MSCVICLANIMLPHPFEARPSIRLCGIIGSNAIVIRAEYLPFLDVSIFFFVVVGVHKGVASDIDGFGSLDYGKLVASSIHSPFGAKVAVKSLGTTFTVIESRTSDTLEGDLRLCCGKHTAYRQCRK